MNFPSTWFAILQVLAVLLIFLGAFLALFLCMMLCLVAAELTCVGASFVRTKITKPASLPHPVSPKSKGHTHLAPRRIGVMN